MGLSSSFILSLLKNQNIDFKDEPFVCRQVVSLFLKGGVLPMAYTHELSYQASCTLRRIAWALGVPMTEAIARVFEHLPKILDRNKVCNECPDKSKCCECVFSAPAKIKSNV
jgi:hypothetical protein